MESYSSLSIEELVRWCAASRSADAWEEFVRRFHRLIATVILRTAARLGDSSKQTVDDLIQETYLKLCADDYRILRSFEQQRPDAFIGYVKVVAANVARDHFKSFHTRKRGAGHVEQLEVDFVPLAEDDSAGSPQSIERAVLIREITHLLDDCVAGPEQERNKRIFWLHYRVRAFRTRHRRSPRDHAHHQGRRKHHPAHYQGVAHPDGRAQGRTRGCNPTFRRRAFARAIVLERRSDPWSHI